eukprot:758707-Hanusia_phi.AAC.1
MMRITFRTRIEESRAYFDGLKSKHILDVNVLTKFRQNLNLAGVDCEGDFDPKKPYILSALVNCPKNHKSAQAPDQTTNATKMVEGRAAGRA